MIAHTSVPVHDWPVVKAELLAATFTDQVKVHYLTHTSERVCLENQDARRPEHRHRDRPKRRSPAPQGTQKTTHHQENTMQDQALVTDADAMLKILNALDRIGELTGITTEQRARVWDAILDPHANWLGAHRVKITPLRTLGEVIQDRTGNPPNHVPTPGDIIDALEAVTTPKGAPAVERPTHDPDV